MQFVGVQVDVTSKTEGTAVGDTAGVPLLVKYDTRIREQGKNAVNEINETVQVPSCDFLHRRLGMQRHTAYPARSSKSCTPAVVSHGAAPHATTRPSSAPPNACCL